MLESIKSDFIRFAGMEIMGKIILGLSFFILGIKIIKDMNYNIEILSNSKFRKKEIISRVVYYLIYFINTVVITLGVYNIKVLNINIFWIFTIALIYLVLRIWSKVSLNDKKEILGIYKDGELIECVPIKDGFADLKKTLPIGEYIIKEYD
ncbi:MAG: hypothetical protein E7F83_03370 [Clostridium sp.]|uniref:Uncharacterized protein n=1 Tax=Clostridium tertium TaxID=1559 RepID=A0A6N3FQ13_9CLOT|nr:hypothetical protein [Clostridium sp.]MDU3546444.1 hypothetical protein [Clostridium sp.]